MKRQKVTVREYLRRAVARRAFDAFQAIQTKLGRWVDPHAVTKTALVYD